MSHLSLQDLPSKSAVAQFYDNRSVFITGATGFMGKVRQRKYCTNYFPAFFVVGMDTAAIITNRTVSTVYH
jgi:FlaA1/EpsC-like NDP-sugar epimerase